MPEAAVTEAQDLAPLTFRGARPRVVVVYNYDAFTYNRVQYLGQLGCELTVLRNDVFTPAQLAELKPDAIVISPGPGTPDRAGQTVPLIRELAGPRPVLGVCLGQQAIAEAFGGRVVPAPVLMHGKTSRIDHDGVGLFAGLPQPLTVTRYHSLVVKDLPAELLVNASVTEAGQETVMAIRHRDLPVWGVQFHPESILTTRSEEHTSELQSRGHLVCRLLLEKK